MTKHFALPRPEALGTPITPFQQRIMEQLAEGKEIRQLQLEMRISASNLSRQMRLLRDRYGAQSYLQLMNRWTIEEHNRRGVNPYVRDMLINLANGISNDCE